jgi:hypothetical protein
MPTNTYIVDPDSKSDGTGSLASPFNTLVGKTFEDDSDYLILPGKVHLGGITVLQSGSSYASRIRIGRYGDGPQPIMLPNGSARTIQIGASGQAVNNITVMDLDIHGGNSTNGTNTNFGATFGFSNAPSNGCQLLRCTVHDVTAKNNETFDHNTVNAFITGKFELRDNHIYNSLNDGVWIDTANATDLIDIRRNRVHGVDQGDSETGDCIQINGPAIYALIGNTLDHSDKASKQGFIISSATSGTGGIAIGNTIIMKTVPGGDPLVSCIYSDQPNDLIIANELKGGNYGLQLVGDNQKAIANLIVAAQFGIVAATGDNPTIMNNTVADCLTYGIRLNTTNAVCHNNLMVRNGLGLSLQSAAVFSHNAYWQNTSDFAWIGDAGSDEENTVTSDPLIDNGYRLRVGSPCIAAGKRVNGVRLLDFFMKEVTWTPDIGAFHVYAARTHATRSGPLRRAS